MKAAFVTGTDTGCGKSAVAAAIARSARAAGLRVRVLKPVETGCEKDAGGNVPADAQLLSRAAGDDRPREALCPYTFALPAAPAVAARAEAVLISRQRLRSAFLAAREDADLLLVEGAGGLLVPIGPQLDMADLARELGLPLIVVARAALGTINHTRLTLESAHLRRLHVAALVVSETTPDLDNAGRANLKWLLDWVRQTRAAQQCISLPHAPGTTPAERSEQLAEHVPLDALLEALAPAP